MWVLEVCSCVNQVDRIQDIDDLHFFRDQMYERLHFIVHSVDRVTSQKLEVVREKNEKRLARLQKEKESLEKRRSEQCTPSTSVIATTTNDSDHEYDAPDADTSDEAMPSRKRLRTKIECVQ